MTKDVIYIDVEDDITTIVGKIKASSDKIIALVPPARYGVLQSAVNMRLLKRTADVAKKRVVIISNSQSLALLAATADIPVAKNLQSKPEVATVPVLKTDDNDIIDGNTLPVGELAATAAVKPSNDTAVDEVIKSSTAASPAKSRSVKSKKTTAKVPNFSTFRKRLLIFGGLGVLLITFLVWAIWFAPRATVIITAKTTPVTVDSNARLLSDGVTDVDAGTIKAIRQSQAADVSVQFTATGERNIGEKATGKVRFRNSQLRAITVPAGTQLSNNDLVFVLPNSVTVPEARCVGSILNCTEGSAEGTVAAAEPGTAYNAARGSLSGAPDGISAAFVSPSGGGTDKMATVVSQGDVDRAAQELAEKKDDSLRAKVEGSFSESNTVIKETYLEERAAPVPSVKVGEEATGPVTLKATITASMMAIDRSELEKFLKTSMEREIEGMRSQKIYSDGSDAVKFSQFVNEEAGPRVRLTANGKIGPVIDEDEVKEQAAGKSYGDIQSSLESIDGVDDVDTQFWPFWVSAVPEDTKRITVEFKIEDVN